MTESYLHPGPDNMAAFMALPDDSPIHMVNFLKYRDVAKYPEGHEHAAKGWSGERAYQEYGRAIAAPFTRVGAKVIWRGAFKATTIGDPAEQWDDLLVVEYPSAKAFLEMINDPEYQAGGVNRTAGLADSRLFRTDPANPSD